MQYKFFNIPARNPAEAEEELNKFLRAHRVVAVHRNFLPDGEASCWCCCVEYLVSGGSTGPAFQHEARGKVDYRELLSDEEFRRFTVLRECRKALAVEDAVPAYAIFIDEQLAEIAKLHEITPAGLKTINGVGEKKVEKYAERLIRLWNARVPEPPKDQMLPTLAEK